MVARQALMQSNGCHSSPSSADYSHFSKSHEEWFQEVTPVGLVTFGGVGYTQARGDVRRPANRT
jgi:hypothetical protein